MKKTLMALTLASLFMAGVVQAENDSATVNISGSVTPDKDECTVTTLRDSVTLNGQLADLPNQGENATAAAALNYSILSSNTDSCVGRIALVLHGVADNADGTTLANTDSSASAAKGMGIGLYDRYYKPIPINNNQITPTTTSGDIYFQAVKLNGQEPVEGTLFGSLTIDIVRL
ncbi:type 1 fimbrial protein [Lelliottia amnigena]|uniref:fimbrial protein n=1 Tax=Lelliottia amnigena TaxID=61646 RepID=UPI001F37F790|nr:fimbrial protein [Lelliottia amnigena]UJD92852.1 type 1 fimbrial protein [Lelliottia amnigena]